MVLLTALYTGVHLSRERLEFGKYEKLEPEDNTHHIIPIPNHQITSINQT